MNPLGAGLDDLAPDEILALIEALIDHPSRLDAALGRLLFGLANAEETPRYSAWVERLQRLLVGPDLETLAIPALEHAALLWPRLTEADRRRLRSVRRDRWARALGRLADSDDPKHRHAVVELAGPGGPRQAFDLLPSLLADRDPSVAAEAERAIVHLAELAHEHPELPARQTIARAIEAVPIHRRRGVVLAAVVLGDRPGAPGPVGELLARPDCPAARAMRSVMRAIKLPIARRRALEWVTTPHLATPASDRLSRCEGAKDHEAALEAWHLLRSPDRASALRGIRVRARVKREKLPIDAELPSKDIEHLVPAPKGPLPDPDLVPRLSVGARRGLLRFVSVFSCSRPLRRSVSAPLLGDPDPVVRLTLASDGDSADLGDLLFDVQPSVARAAANRYSLVGLDAVGGAGHERRMDAFASARRASNRAVRTIAVQETERADPFASSGPAARVAARRAFERDATAFEALVRETIGHGSADRRRNAVSLLVPLGLAQSLASELMALVLDDDAQTAARAVGGLVSVSGADASAAIQRALRHIDPRVRANALEALDRRLRLARGAASAPRVEEFVEHKTDAAHRIRANATAAMLRHLRTGEGGLFDPAGVTSLAGLLGDDRAPHRRAGVWLANKILLGQGRRGLGLAWRDLADRVEVIAGSDPDSGVRARAQTTVRGLRSLTRGEWASRPIGIAG
ncbi:MAG: hypothetical protein AAGB51_00545 [Planctomycetota bacterium]